MKKKFSLSKQERLKSRKLIEHLFKGGKIIVSGPFKVFYDAHSALLNSGQSNGSLLQFGVGVSSRNFKKAVDRNRVKRLIREAYRLQKTELCEAAEKKEIQLAVFFIYTSREIPQFEIVKQKVSIVLDKIIKKLEDGRKQK